MEICYLPDKEYEVIVSRLVTKLGGRIEKLSENINRVRIYNTEPIRVEEYNHQREPTADQIVQKNRFVTWMTEQWKSLNHKSKKKKGI